MMGDGLVSVIMPLYNAEKYVAAAIDSVIAQSYDNWELIIVDDGSTDGSLAVASSYSSDRIRILSQPNHGACVARNKALLHAKGTAFVTPLGMNSAHDTSSTIATKRLMLIVSSKGTSAP